MASSKKIGFFWGEEQITLVEFERNAPLRVVTSPRDIRSNSPSPFSSNLSEEIQITAIFQKLLQDNRITGGTFFISLPMKEIILRSFVIPFVKQQDIQNAIKFEAKRYLPIDIQELTFSFYTSPLIEKDEKRLQVIFFAVRKETLDRYDRIFKQVRAATTYCEPCVVSLAKVLLFKKEISPTDHLAYLILDKNAGRICFIDQGMPQFIREFSIGSQSPSGEAIESSETLNLKIVNEVGNSFDFYARQFSGERIDQLLISSEAVDQNLLNALESELKLKIRKTAPVTTMGEVGQGNNMDAVYAMGACVEPVVDNLSGFNFFEDKIPKSKLQTDISSFLKSYKEFIFISLMCVVFLVVVHLFFQVQLKVTQQQYNQLSSKQGAYASTPLESIEADLQQNTDKLLAYKNIRTKSDVVLILLKVASHLPEGSFLKQFNITYDDKSVSDVSQGESPVESGLGAIQKEAFKGHAVIDMTGLVLGEDSNEEIPIVSEIYLDIKNDKELGQFFKNVNLVNSNRESFNDKDVMEFNIHCS